MVYQPALVVRIRNVTKRPGIAVRLSFEAFSSPPGSINSPSRSHRIPMNSQYMQKLLPVGIRGQQGCENGRARRHQRPPRPPDVQAVRSGKRRHRRPFARMLSIPSAAIGSQRSIRRVSVIDSNPCLGMFFQNVFA